MRVVVTVEEVSDGDNGPIDTDKIEALVEDHLDQEGHDHGPVVVTAV